MSRAASRSEIRELFEAFQGRSSRRRHDAEKSHHAPKHVAKLGGLVELHLADGRPLRFSPREHLLCADADRRLWVFGAPLGIPNKQLADDDLENVSLITHVIYRTRKPHLGDDELTTYCHEFGEEGGELPTLALDSNGYPVIDGGSYFIESVGIRD